MVLVGFLALEIALIDSGSVMFSSPICSPPMDHSF
jgi:hypothetical protein